MDTYFVPNDKDQQMFNKPCLGTGKKTTLVLPFDMNICVQMIKQVEVNVGQSIRKKSWVSLGVPLRNKCYSKKGLKS